MDFHQVSANNLDSYLDIENTKCKKKIGIQKNYNTFL